MGSLFEDLLSPDAYPEPRPPAIELRETHISSVYLAGPDVYKVKKAVDFGFLDFSTQQKRLAACEAEVVLNRRLSPGVYLGVVPIALGADGRHRIGTDGQIAPRAPRSWGKTRAPRLLGVAATTRVNEPMWSGAHDKRFTDDVYAETTAPLTGGPRHAHSSAWGCDNSYQRADGDGRCAEETRSWPAGLSG